MTERQARRVHILVVDDDRRIRQMLTRYFEDEGYRVSDASDGPSLRSIFDREPIDIILLDIGLPGGEDGLSLARHIRSRSDVPIIMLTGRDDVMDRVVGLELGADDYIAKPFHLREVLARLRTVLRRRQGTAAASRPDSILHFSGWSLDVAARHLTAPDGTPVSLTTGEFDLLVAFAGSAGRVLSRDQLMALTRGRDMNAFDRSIDAQVARLRKKIETDPGNPTLIKSVRGAGYVFTGREG